MKKTLLIILVLSFCLSALVGCGNAKYKGPLSCISRIGVDGVSALMDMTEEAQKKILSALNRGEWVDDLTNCGYDCEFTTENETVRYHSECGTFIDVTNKRSMTLSEEDMKTINALLGVTENEETHMSCLSTAYNDRLKITEEQAEAIKTVWNNGVWENDVTKTEYDYVFRDGDIEVRYSYEEGIFNDITSGKYLVLSDEVKT